MSTRWLLDRGIGGGGDPGGRRVGPDLPDGPPRFGDVILYSREPADPAIDEESAKSEPCPLDYRSSTLVSIEQTRTRSVRSILCTWKVTDLGSVGAANIGSTAPIPHSNRAWAVDYVTTSCCRWTCAAVSVGGRPDGRHE